MSIEASDCPGSRAISTGFVGFLLTLAACGSGDAGLEREARVTRRPPAASTTSMLRYHGGRVLSAAEIVVVFWGTDVPADVVGRTPAVYRTLAELNDFDWISEYDTASQHIHRPRYLGAVVIDPEDAGTTLSDGGIALLDEEIVAELGRQLDAGLLPPATEDRYYAAYFPPGVTILDPDGNPSCTGWSAYHGNFGDVVGTYAVFPSCGETAPIAVHELFETVTDPHYDGWTTQSGEEIGDLCQTLLTSLQLPDGGSLDVQPLWSNVGTGCLGSGNAFTLSMEPWGAPAAAELTFTVTLTPTRNPYTRLSWKVSGLPDGGTSTLLPPRDGSGRWTLTVDLPPVERAFLFAVEARTEFWSASTAAAVSRAPASSGVGCSQASGRAWPEGYGAALLLAVVGLRRRR